MVATNGVVATIERGRNVKRGTEKNEEKRGTEKNEEGNREERREEKIRRRKGRRRRKNNREERRRRIEKIEGAEILLLGRWLQLQSQHPAHLGPPLHW